jgi:hypothetical protein
MIIPYGRSNFAEIRASRAFYADKTRFLPLLESGELGNAYLVLLRPRRAGKSLLISMLEHYYDLAQAERFDALFEGLYVHAHPTPLRNRYLVLTLDFSPVQAGTGLELFQTSFFAIFRAKVWALLDRYQHLSPALRELLQALDSFREAASLLTTLCATVQRAGYQLYLLIDEYDAFANDLIALGNVELYRRAVDDTGFVRAFYRAVKEGTRAGAIDRVFITGVLPMMLDDMASGFNVSSQITHVRQFNALCGLTRAEVEQAVDQFLALTPLMPRDALLAELERYYNGYRFVPDASERLFNPDMVLYYLMELRRSGAPPTQVLDNNVRVDFTKLRHVASPPGGVQAWHEDYVTALLTEGRLLGNVIDRFGLDTLYDRQYFISLLYFMGLITLEGPREGQLSFRIPNTVVRTLHWEALATMLREKAAVVVDTGLLQTAASRMAYRGELAPFCDLLLDEVLKRLSKRDLRYFNEKGVKLIWMTYLSMSPIFRPVSEAELQQGYGDIFLGLDRRFPDAKYTWLIELKYVKAGAKRETIAAAQAEAAAQIDRYLADPVLLPLLKGDRALKAATVVVQGARAIHHAVVRELG